MKKLEIPNRAELESFQKELAKLLAAATAKASKLEALAETLRNEIEQEEATLDATDRKAIEQVASKKLQLKTVETQMQRESEKADAQYDALRQHLLGFREVWGRALQPAYRDALDKVTAGLVPFYQSEGHARQAAINTQLVQYVYASEFRTLDAGDPAYDQIPIAQRCLRKIEALFSGEAPFPAAFPTAKAA